MPNVIADFGTLCYSIIDVSGRLRLSFPLDSASLCPYIRLQHGKFGIIIMEAG